MKTKIELYRKKETGQFVYLINIGGIINEFITESGAHRFLERHGYIYDYESGIYEKRASSQAEIEIKWKYEKVIK